MRVPPNFAISGKTLSALVLRAMTKSAEPPAGIDCGDVLDPFVIDSEVAELGGQGSSRRTDCHPKDGTRKINPKRKPQNAPPAAAAPVRLVPW